MFISYPCFLSQRTDQVVVYQCLKTKSRRPLACKRSIFKKVKSSQLQLMYIYLTDLAQNSFLYEIKLVP